MKKAGIDFSNGYIKVAIESGDGSIDIKALEFAVEPENKASRKEFNRLLLAVLKAKPDTIYSSIGRQSATVRFLRLPSSDEREIEGMLEFQATKQLPFSKEEIVIGHRVLSTDEQGYSRVMLVVAQRNIIESHLSALKAAGIVPEYVCLSTEAVFNWFLSSGMNKDIPKQSLYILADIDNIFSELLVCQGDQILFSRAFEHGAGALHKCGTSAEIALWAEMFKDHIKLSYMAFKKENVLPDAKAELIFISGGVTKFYDDIKARLEKEFNVKTQFCGVREPEAAQYPVSLTAVCGMASPGADFKINLIPQEIRLKRALKKKKEELFKFYALCSAIFACIAVLAGARFFYKGMYLRYLDNQLLQLRPDVQKAEVLADKLKIIDAQVDRSGTALEALKEFYNIMPQDIKISNLSMNEGTITIRGASGTMSRIFEAVKILEDSKVFKNVKVVFTNKRKAAGGEIVDFQITCGMER